MRKFLAAYLLAIILLCSACSGIAQPMSAEEFANTSSFANPKTDALLAYLKTNNYPAFSQDFTDAMKSKLTQLKYNELRADLQQKLGKFQSRNSARGEKYMGFLVVNYTLRFEKALQVNLQVSFTADEPHQIAGLQFSAPELNK